MKTKQFPFLIRGVLFLFLCSMLLDPGSVVDAQQTRKIAHVGYLTNDSTEVDRPRRDAFRQGLRDLGYIEGQTIIIEYRVGEGHVERLPELAAELVRMKCDVIFAFTTAGALAAKNATKEI